MQLVFASDSTYLSVHHAHLTGLQAQQYYWLLAISQGGVWQYAPRSRLLFLSTAGTQAG